MLNYHYCRMYINEKYAPVIYNLFVGSDTIHVDSTKVVYNQCTQKLIAEKDVHIKMIKCFLISDY